MHAITLHQPSASLVAIGAKPFETRTYPPPTKGKPASAPLK